MKTAWRRYAAFVVAALVLVTALALSTGSVPGGSRSGLSLAAPGGASAQGIQAADVQAQSGPEVVSALKHDTSPALRDLAPVAAAQAEQNFDQERILPVPNHNASAQPLAAFGDPVLQDAFVGSNIPAPSLSFNGIGNLFGGWPPDTEGDVGLNHYVQWINTSFQIWDKNGNSLYGPAAGNTLWAGFGGICETTNSGDPIVLYDPLADRWLMSQFAFATLNGPFHQCIAVSTTGNPLGTWTRYDFLWSNAKLNDYPKFGVWPDGYYMTANQFNAGSLTWGGQGVAVFERSQMLTGGPARMVKFDLFSVDADLGGMLPADLDGPAPPAGEPNPFAEVDDNAAGGFPQDQLQIWDFHVDWSNTALSTFTHVISLATAAFDSEFSCGSNGQKCIPQPGTTAKLDVLSDRLMHRLQYRNFGSYQSLVTNHTVDVDGSSHAGVRWYELRRSGGAWSVYQQGTYAPDASHRWMGSAAMNGQGEIALGYSNSSTSIYPSVRYTGRAASDPLGSLPQGEGTLVTGSGAQTDDNYNRWGDYSMLAVDPADDCTFWYTQEWVQTTGSNTWKTRIGAFSVTTCATRELNLHYYLPLVYGGDAPPPTIVNGDFESGLTGWAEYSLKGWGLILDSASLPVPPHGGNWAVWLGGDNDEIAYIEQQVTIPPSAPFLAYWHWIGSLDTCGHDFGSVRVDGAIAETYDLCVATNTAGWVKHVVDLGAYAGQSVSLQIRIDTDSILNSNLFVDDVNFQSTAAASAASGPSNPGGSQPAESRADWLGP